jgi:putative ABC transport system permease protein
MIKNYLKIAWRNMLNNKVYGALNIVGLAAGMAVALLIGLWVVNEYSYDRFLPNYKQLYQVDVNFTIKNTGVITQNAVSIPVADVLRKNYPEIKAVAVSDWMGSHDLLAGTKKLYVNGASIGSDFLKMFRYPLIKGNENTVLNDPFSIVLTESTAKALFGDADPIDKIVRIDNLHDVKVTGIMKDVPANSSLQFNYLLPFSYSLSTVDWIRNASTQWENQSLQMFVELQPNADYAKLAPKIKNILYNHEPGMREVKPEIILQPLRNWHLYSEFKDGKATSGFIEYVRMFSIIGILVLLIACINFMNLSTARSEKRAREVGVRKAIGSSRLDLIFQFLTESLLVTFLSFLLSILFVQLALPAFNTITGSSISIPYGNGIFWILMILYILLTGLLAGSRPAFYLSSFKPVKVLKGSIQIGKAATLPRKILVVIQFSCSVALIISTVIIYQQIQYVKNRPVGYSSERLVMTDMSGDLANNYKALKNDLLQAGVVESVTTATSPLTGISNHQGIEKWPEKNASDQSINAGGISVSDNYFKTVGMKLIMGRDFSSIPGIDSLNVIVNEAAVSRMGLKNPINQIITFNGVNGPARIIGVVKNALMESPFAKAEPTVFNHIKEGNILIYRLSANASTHESIEKTAKIFNTYNPAYPYSYQFADDAYNHKFKLEMLVGKLSGVFAGLAVFISCLGLFGLAVYVAEQRNKEIGVRKVLGASVAQIWLLLSRDFIVLIVISCVIASPVAFYFISNWLQKYDYHITIGPGAFVLAAIMAMAITLLTISFQAIKAALMNPVKSLRSE